MLHKLCITATLVLAFGLSGTPKAEGSASASSQGCKTIDVPKPAYSFLFHSRVYEFHVLEHWCWDGDKITELESSCYASDVNSISFNYNGCGVNASWFYRWRGSSQGGHFVQAQGSFGNCAFHIGCVGNHYPIIRVWVNAGGGWSSDPKMKGATNNANV